jgi:hypothetical protein
LSAVAGRAVCGLRWLPRSPPRRATAAAGILAGKPSQSLPRAWWGLECENQENSIYFRVSIYVRGCFVGNRPFLIYKKSDLRSRATYNQRIIKYHINMNRIDAKTFIRAWVEFSKEFTSKNPNWLDSYQSSISWSTLFLGGKKSTEENSPIGNFLKDKFALRYRVEDGLFDLAFSSSENFKQIPYLSRNVLDYFEPEYFFPAYYDIIMEIENEYVCAWQEMTKLTWVRCPLKVLVTYNGIKEKQKENEMLIQSFQTIIKQAIGAYPENPETEYVLIVGNDLNQKLNWECFVFSNEGKQKHTEKIDG